eukprot:CAMPEP_0116008332 /NCGR_PEP_ID=MMETSP0321-20121206/2804_1 /TAXON_ID=163516 /ORGANISM="Leptocylindrus danicus var. danicus, Strain B650" /LENGTH=992 /DNA_ID=CAMNT_0003477143 /DNA_START=1459 /DNA_END=4437 /DNA_ORIENTATION=+
MKTVSHQLPKNDAFLDAFWHLSSTDDGKRTASSALIIQHCYGSGDSEVNQDDAEYTMKRLMRGICGGKSGARQGFAGTLASFLQARLSHTDTANVLSDAEYVHKKLMDHTSVDGDMGMSKGDERDAAFGRLFGILAVVRSNTLQHIIEHHYKDDGDGGNNESVVQLLQNYMVDLIKLFNYKKWMQDAAAFAICEVLRCCACNDAILKNVKSSSNGDIETFLDNETNENQVAIQFYLATLTDDYGAIDAFEQEDLRNILFSAACNYPKQPLIYEKIIEVMRKQEKYCALFVDVITDLADSTVERRAFSLILYQKFTYLAIEGGENYMKHLKIDSVLKLLFNNNEKKTLTKLGMQIRNEIFAKISGQSLFSFASIYYDYMTPKVFLREFYSKFSNAEKTDFVQSSAKIGDLYQFSRIDRNAEIMDVILNKLVENAENDEEITSKLVSLVGDLLTNNDLEDDFFPKVNKLILKSKKKSKNALQKLRVVLEIYQKLTELELGDELEILGKKDMSAANLAEVCTNLLQVNLEGICCKLLFHSVKKMWTEFVKENDEPFDSDLSDLLCGAIGCPVDDDASMSDASSEADLADLALSDDDDESSSSASTKDDEDNGGSTMSVDNDEKSDDDSDEEEEEEEEALLEHDESADAALANLIEMKQNMRKKAQTSQQRENYKNQSRCILLIEVYLQHKNSLVLSPEFFWRLLSMFRTTDQKLKKSDNLAEGKQFLQRLTALFAQISKLKNVDKDTCGKIDLMALCSLLQKSKSPQYSKACSHIVSFAYKNNLAEETDFVNFFDKMVDVWANKRGPEFSGLFEDFCRFDGIAQKALIGPLTKSSQNGRTDFIKQTSFHLLTPILSTDTSFYDDNTTALSEIFKSCLNFLQRDEKSKSQHKISCLKLLEKTLQIAKIDPSSTKSLHVSTSLYWSVVEGSSVDSVLNSVGESCKAQGVISRVKIIRSEITAGLLLFSALKVEEEENKPTTSSAKKSAKKKKKKSKK